MGMAVGAHVPLADGSQANGPTRTQVQLEGDAFGELMQPREVRFMYQGARVHGSFVRVESLDGAKLSYTASDEFCAGVVEGALLYDLDRTRLSLDDFLTKPLDLRKAIKERVLTIEVASGSQVEVRDEESGRAIGGAFATIGLVGDHGGRIKIEGSESLVLPALSASGTEIEFSAPGYVSRLVYVDKANPPRFVSLERGREVEVSASFDTGPAWVSAYSIPDERLINRVAYETSGVGQVWRVPAGDLRYQLHIGKYNIPVDIEVVSASVKATEVRLSAPPLAQSLEIRVPHLSSYDGVENITAILTRPGWGTISYSTRGEALAQGGGDAHFYFSNIASGEYSVSIEPFGIARDLTIAPGEQRVEEIDASRSSLVEVWLVNSETGQLVDDLDCGLIPKSGEQSMLMLQRPRSEGAPFTLRTTLDEFRIMVFVEGYREAYAETGSSSPHERSFTIVVEPVTMSLCSLRVIVDGSLVPIPTGVFARGEVYFTDVGGDKILPSAVSGTPVSGGMSEAIMKVDAEGPCTLHAPAFPGLEPVSVAVELVRGRSVPAHVSGVGR